LIVWQKAKMLATDVYQLTRAMPAEERFGVVPQLRRAAMSVAANIAEGHGRMSNGDYVRHLSIARGSALEVEALLTISTDLELCPRERIAAPLAHTDEISRMLAVMIRKLGRKGPRS